MRESGPEEAGFGAEKGEAVKGGACTFVRN